MINIHYIFSVLLVFSVTYSGYSRILSITAYVCLIIAAVLIYISDRRNKLGITIFLFVVNSIFCVQLILSSPTIVTEHALRFFIVINLLILAATNKYRFFLRECFFLVTMIHSFVVIAISLMLSIYSISKDYSLWLAFRHFVQLYQIGDIWTNDGIFFRVQLLGNPMIFGLFCYTLIFYDKLKTSYSTKFVHVIFFASLFGTIAAGNINYLIIVFFGTLYMITKLNIVYFKFFLLILSILLMPFIVYFLVDSIYIKFANGAHSGNHRLMLIETFIYAITLNPFNFLIGFGLDATLPGKFSPVVLNAQYIELQSILVLYKLGAILFFILLLLYLYGIFKLHGKQALIFICIYVLGSLANPYIFDTQHIIMTFLASTGLSYHLRRERK